MKKFFVTVAVALCIAVTTTGCGITLLNNTNSDTNLTNVELSNANFRVIKDVEGFSSATYIFGIGGLSEKAARDNAVADMTRNAELKGSQALVNVHIKSHVSTVLFIYTRVSCTATGQVIEFLPSETTPSLTDDGTSLSPKYQPITGNQKIYNIGDLFDDGNVQGYVFDISDGGLHGKIVYPTLKPNTQWCVDQSYKSYIKYSEDGEDVIRSVQSKTDWESRYPAYAVCDNLGPNWYIPTIKELTTMYENLPKDNIIINILNGTNVWSSTVLSPGRVMTFWNSDVAVTKECVVLAVARF